MNLHTARGDLRHKPSLPSTPMALKQNRLLYFRLFLLNTGSINISVHPEGSGSSGSTAILPSQQQKLLSLCCNNLAPQWGQTLIGPRVMRAGLGVQCTGRSSQRLLEAPACLQALLSDVTRSLAALLRAVFSLLTAALMSDGCRVRIALLLAVFSLRSVAVSMDVLQARATFLLSALSLCSAALSIDVFRARTALLLSVSSLCLAALSVDVLRARAVLSVLSLCSAALSVDVLRARATLLLAVSSRFSGSNSSALVSALLLILSAALLGAVRSYVLPDLVVTPTPDLDDMVQFNHSLHT